MRWLVMVVVVACRTAQPLEVPQTPARSGSGGFVLDLKYLDNIPVPGEYEGCCIDGETTDEGVFGPVGIPSPSIVGRYYIDGIYVESRGPRFPIWR
jgi:hypothetical protein